MLENLTLVTELFNVQERPVGFNVKSPRVSDSAQQLILKLLWLMLILMSEYKLCVKKLLTDALPHVRVSRNFLQKSFFFGWLTKALYVKRLKLEAIRC